MEIVELFRIFRRGNRLHAELSNDNDNTYQLYGFLKMYIKLMEEDLLDDFEDYGVEH